MTHLSIVLWPDPVLGRPTEPVGVPDPEIRQLAADMLETMYAAPGRGLAAPQVGFSKRLFVMDVTWKEAAPWPLVCIDPEILWSSEETSIFCEGCLSLPGITAEISRPKAIRMTWTGLEGDRHMADLSGVAARCALHEVDHLDGLVTLDRLSPEARAAAEAEYRAA